MNETKFCIYCRYCSEGPNMKGELQLDAEDLAQCRQVVTGVNPVTGRNLYLKCRDMRDKFHACGPDGMLFKPR